MNYSQFGQDIFVLEVLGNNYAGSFVDIGCQRPYEISNSLSLEERGWKGVAIDIIDYSREWISRKTQFLCLDALQCDFYDIFHRGVTSF